MHSSEFEAQVLQSPVASHADDLPRHEAYRNEGQSNPFELRMFFGVEGESLLIEFRHMFQICASFLQSRQVAAKWFLHFEASHSFFVGMV
jgi:hypothetical protein